MGPWTLTPSDGTETWGFSISPAADPTFISNFAFDANTGMVTFTVYCTDNSVAEPVIANHPFTITATITAGPSSGVTDSTAIWTLTIQPFKDIVETLTAQQYYLVNTATLSYTLNALTASPSTTEIWTYLGFYSSSLQGSLIPEITVTNNAGTLQVDVYSTTDVSGVYEIWIEAQLDTGETEIVKMSDLIIYFISYTPIGPYMYTLNNPYTNNVAYAVDILIDSAYYHTPTTDGSTGTLSLSIVNVANPGNENIISDGGDSFTIGDNGLTNYDPLLYEGLYEITVSYTINTCGCINNDQVIQVNIREEIIPTPPTMGSSSFTIEESSMISTSGTMTWAPADPISW